MKIILVVGVVGVVDVPYRQVEGDIGEDNRGDY